MLTISNTNTIITIFGLEIIEPMEGNILIIGVIIFISFFFYPVVGSDFTFINNTLSSHRFRRAHKKQL